MITWSSVCMFLAHEDTKEEKKSFQIYSCFFCKMRTFSCLDPHSSPLYFLMDDSILYMSV